MNRFAMLFISGFVVLISATAHAAITGPVKIDSGLITGTAGTSLDIRAFKGIPFAAPPIGSLRWRPPQPVAKWDGIRKAEEFSPRCIQGAPGGGRGGAPTPATSEDCLYLNVWTGAKSASERRPVIVFTYGGGFTSGAGSEPRYDGEALARKGVVFVTYNYRLGVFGFFAHPELTAESDHQASGNYGLMDFIAALKWVQRNVTNFGGDPKRVTIMGESAGAIAVAALVGSPEGKGLFQRAIAESGAWMGLGINGMPQRAPAEEAGMKLGSLSELRMKPADEMMRIGRSTGMIVDGWIVPEDLSNTFAHGRQNDVDVLVGSNQDEGTFFQRGQRSSDPAAEAAQLKRMSDEVSWHMRTWAKLQSKRGRKAYWYYFTKVPPTAPGQQSRGATHTAELAYVFNNLIPPSLPWTDTDRMLAGTLSSYWASFAARGDPNGKGLPVWPAFNEKASERTMLLGDKVEAAPGLDSERVGFFDQAYAKLFQ
jgi:para-nitrobenzyl esterase